MITAIEAAVLSDNPGNETNFFISFINDCIIDTCKAGKKRCVVHLENASEIDCAACIKTLINAGYLFVYDSEYKKFTISWAS